jgi:hypothetical protein
MTSRVHALSTAHITEKAKSSEAVRGMEVNIPSVEEKGKIDGARFSAFLAVLAMRCDNFLYHWTISAVAGLNSLEIGPI